jgi:hypothetical protein
MNILSIDIDFLFTDMMKIQMYMDTELKPQHSWKVIGWKSKIKEFKPCVKSAQFVNNILNKCITKNTLVETITEHDEIIKIFNKHKVEEADVFNVDYHHDITYGNTDDEVNIENWVMFGKKNNQIKNYYWIGQADSKPCKESLIQFKQSYWKDIDLDKLPKFDLIVLCTSKHFTPPKYWKLCEKIKEETELKIELLGKNLNYFKPIKENVLNVLPIEDYPDYFCGSKNKSDFLFHYNQCYVDVYIEEETGVAFLSMINLGEADNIFKLKEVVDHCLKIFGVLGFSFVNGIRNEIYIRRLLRNYKVISEKVGKNSTKIIFREV